MPRGQESAKRVHALVVGAGFGGLAVARELGRRGITDLLVVERADEVGGTWRDNRYPGIACDIPSDLYSLSYAPNPAWTRLFPPGPEIQDYLRDCVGRLGLEDAVSLGDPLESAAWDDTARVWRARTGRGTIDARILVLATGPLSEPAYPDIPGLGDFAGRVVHTGAWPDEGIGLAGLRVGVIGTGASAIQVVPAIQPLAAHLVVFQRTPPWILPRHDRATSPRRRALFEALPAAQRLVRAAKYWRRELTTPAFTTSKRLMGLAEGQARAHLRSQVPDTALRARLEPAYDMGCKRILLSDDYYPALGQPNVALVAEGIARIEPDAVVTADGTRHELDVLILATGFDVMHPPITDVVVGSAGEPLAAVLGDHPVAHLGATVPGFPNMFIVTGPNSGLGNNSMIFMIESHANYIADAAALMERHGLASFDLRPDAYREWDELIEERSRRTVWSAGGCRSWYLDANGRNAALWPWGTMRFRRMTRRFDPESYVVRR